MGGSTASIIEITQPLQPYFRATHFEGELLAAEAVKSFPAPRWCNRDRTEGP